MNLAERAHGKEREGEGKKVVVEVSAVARQGEKDRARAHPWEAAPARNARFSFLSSLRSRLAPYVRKTNEAPSAMATVDTSSLYLGHSLVNHSDHSKDSSPPLSRWSSSPVLLLPRLLSPPSPAWKETRKGCVLEGVLQEA